MRISPWDTDDDSTRQHAYKAEMSTHHLLNAPDPPKKIKEHNFTFP